MVAQISKVSLQAESKQVKLYNTFVKQDRVIGSAKQENTQPFV
jgi:hypothetical protein